MNWKMWLFWGAIATIAQFSFEALTHGLKLTRVNLPFILGSIYTGDRARARLIGALHHMANGVLFALVYVAIFHSWGGSTWWKGAIVGFCHAGFVLLVALPLLPEFHPRMATERHGPTVKKRLEPPGFLALNYGHQTPIAIVISHVIFGVVLGMFCHVG